MRHLLSEDNADRKDFFREQGLAYLERVSVSDDDGFVLDQLRVLWEHVGRMATPCPGELVASLCQKKAHWWKPKHGRFRDDAGDWPGYRGHRPE